jgi:hypothetical protein
LTDRRRRLVLRRVSRPQTAALLLVNRLRRLRRRRPFALHDAGADCDADVDGLALADARAGRHPSALHGDRQLELTLLSVFPFFEAYLRGDEAMLRFLEQGLAPQNPEIALEVQK